MSANARKGTEGHDEGEAGVKKVPRCQGAVPWRAIVTLVGLTEEGLLQKVRRRKTRIPVGKFALSCTCGEGTSTRQLR